LRTTSSLLLLIVAVAPMILITALLISAILAMPLIVSFVAARDYPDLEKRRGGTIAGSILNALVAVLVFAALWIATLPLWLTGFLAPVIPLLLSAYLNQRLFRYDALSDHASDESFAR
jgi:amino acid transporter